MREAIAERAKISGRSMNAEIISMLDQALDPSEAELKEMQAELKLIARQRHEAAGVLEGLDRRMYALVDRVKGLQDSLGIVTTMSEDDHSKDLDKE